MLRTLLPLVPVGMILIGCSRTPEPRFIASKQVQELPEQAQQQIARHLDKYCGTPLHPRLLGNDTIAPAHLQRGAAVYQERCAACHGVTGDGAGPAAEYLVPRPRDYRRGIFKFTSTPYGSKPLRADLLNTVRRGAKGTSMPSFALLPQQDLEAVVDYVLALTHRGELEFYLALEAESEDEIDPEVVPDLVSDILEQWKDAADQEVTPQSKMIPYTAESVELGRKAFLTEEAGCFKCHGDDGRGMTVENQAGFQDSWGFPTRAADLSAGMFHGGDQPIDIYRRVYSGINGTPMPSFSEKLADQPETFWHLVHYVQHISSARRRAVMSEEDYRQPAKK